MQAAFSRLFVLDDKLLLLILDALPIGLELYVEDSVAPKDWLRRSGSERSVHLTAWMIAAQTALKTPSKFYLGSMSSLSLLYVCSTVVPLAVFKIHRLQKKLSGMQPAPTTFVLSLRSDPSVYFSVSSVRCGDNPRKAVFCVTTRDSAQIAWRRRG